jgi:tRNA/tmRNA/rRNA uracil-C5-methylase (TrmA/RlmC/RlmD family)
MKKRAGIDIMLVQLLFLSLYEGATPFGFAPSRGAMLANQKRCFALSASSGKPSSRSKKPPGASGKLRKPIRGMEPRERPVLTEYDLHRNHRVNLARLSDPIGCEHFGKCPGCVVDNKVGQVDVIKSAKLFFASTAIRKKRLDVRSDNVVSDEDDDGFFQVVVPSPLTGWRTQAKLAVAPRSSSWARDGCALGLYQRGTHSVMEIPNCKVHHPSINRAADSIRRATEAVNIAAYNEETREGGLRYVQLQVERATGKISLTLVWNAEALKDTQPALTKLVKELQSIEPDLWHSIWCHCNDGPGNNIFARNPSRWHRLVGSHEFLREPLAAGTMGWLYFSPLAFRQGNMDGFDILAIDVAKAVPGGSRVCELYAGVGLLGLTALAYHGNRANPLKWVRCSDENAANPRCFRRAVDSLPASVAGHQGEGKKQPSQEVTLAEMVRLMAAGEQDPFKSEREKASYVVASATKALQDGQALGADVLIVDPPRKGLEPEVLEELCKPFNPNQGLVESKDLITVEEQRVNWTNDVKTLIYVSCGFDAFARDCEQLLKSGAGWMLASATGYVLFPGSDHVETLAVFQRR